MRPMSVVPPSLAFFTGLIPSMGQGTASRDDDFLARVSTAPRAACGTQHLATKETPPCDGSRQLSFLSF